MKSLAALLLVCSALSTAKAGTFIPQASFSVAGAAVAGMDRDAAGNLYVLARVPGTATSYTVASYQTPSITPEFSFGVTITTPLAFAVEANGVIDILDAGNALTLTRWDNAGNQISQVSRISPYMSSYFTAAFDKSNGLFYFSYPYRVCQSVGDFGCNLLYYQGAISQYNFSGQLQKTFDLPGRTTISTTCYTPSMMSVDDQGTLWVGDSVCNQVLAYNSQGAQTKDISLPYAFFPRSIWTGPGENLFVAHAICNSYDCSQGQVVEFNSAGVQQYTGTTTSIVGEAWDSRILYMASPSGGTLQRFILDTAPTAPVPSSPQGVVVQHSSMATINWQTANDAEGDTLLYSVYIGPSASQLSFAGSTSQTNFTSAALSFGTNYYWQVTAQDSYLGLPMLTSNSAIVGFGLSFTNNPPGGFTPTAGTGTAVTRSASVTFGWTAAIDPDGDPVTYTVSWQPAGQSAPTVVTTAANLLTVTGLTFGTNVNWSVKACDPYAACTPMTGGTQVYLPVFQDSPPSAPTITGGTGVIAEHTLTPTATLTWSTSANPFGDPIGYRLYLGTNPGALALAQDGTQTSYALGNMSFGTTYYWQVNAYDPYGGVGTAPTQSVVAQLQNNPPLPFAVITGTGTLATRSTSQLLSWAAAVDPDGDTVTYEVDLSTNPAALAAVQTSTATSFNLTVQLGVTYYWQVIARDGFGGVTLSGLQTFLPVFLDLPPTVPINQSKTGTILYHGFSPSLSFFWQAATSPQGDPFSYTLYYGTAPSHMVAVSSAPLGYTISNLPLNQAIYYQIVATDIYGAASPSPVNWVYYQFTNIPPGPFDIVGTTGTIYTRQTSANLTWTPCIDPDGDSVSYGVFTGTAPSALSLMTSTTKTSAALSNMAFGTTYYWNVTAYDGFGGTTTVNEGIQSLVYLFYDPAPSSIVYVSTANSYSLHTSSPSVTLSWLPSANAAGDPVSYRLDMQTSTGTWPSIPMAAATSISLPVIFETTYTWRVEAFDPYGGASTGAWMSFIVHLANRPPNPIIYSSLTSLVTRATSYTLTWQDTGDPDGDPYSYSLCLSTNPATQYVVQRGTQISYALNFQFGMTYYWRVSATDSFGARTEGALQTFQPVFENTPPPAPAIIQSTGTLSEHALVAQVPLSWSAVQDPDGDLTNYVLYVGTTTSGLAAVQSSTQTSFVIANPRFGVTYYWQVSAQNPYGGASTTTLQTATPVFQNNPPGAFTVALGTGTLISRTTTQILTWSASVDPDGDPVSYSLSLSSNPARMSVVQASTATSYSLAFAFGTTYYWTVSAFDDFGGTTTITGGAQSFLPTFLDQAPLAVQLAPQPVVTTMRGSVAISWQQVTNAEGDPVSYTIYLGDSPGALQPFAEITPSSSGGAATQSVRVLDTTPQAQSQIAGSTITLTLTGLNYYHAYYMRIRAADPYGGTSMSQVQTFTLGSMNGFPTAYNYPNPFNPLRGGTNIVFNAPPSGYAKATVEVYSEWQDLLFRQDYFNIPSGVSQVPFAGRDRSGRPLFNGSYICRVRFSGPDDKTIFYLLVVK